MYDNRTDAELTNEYLEEIRDGIRVIGDTARLYAARDFGIDLYADSDVSATVSTLIAEREQRQAAMVAQVESINRQFDAVAAQLTRTECGAQTEYDGIRYRCTKRFDHIADGEASHLGLPVDPTTRALGKGAHWWFSR